MMVFVITISLTIISLAGTHTHTHTQVWHKACFRCEVCNMKLTMKTYKGYNKMPYCNT